jgi:signal transduction histidine kinase
MVRRLLGMTVTSVAMLLSPAADASHQGAARVVVLNGSDPNLPAFISIDQAMRADLTAPGRPPVEIFSETLDMMRFPGADFEAEMMALLRKKYGRHPIDAVVAVAPAALDFAERHRQELWPRAAIVFHSVPDEVLRARPAARGTVGVLVHHDVSGTLDLALRLRPQTRRVVVVSGVGDFDRMMREIAQNQLSAYETRLTVEHWSGGAFGEVKAAIGKLPPDAVVIYLSIFRDGNGQTFVPRSALTELSAASSVPVFGAVESFVGKGIAAGSVDSLEARGRRAAVLVREALAAARTGVLPVSPAPTSICSADARELRRWNLDADLLPDGCRVVNVEVSPWIRYRWQIVTGLAIIVSQFALIAALLFQRRRRLRAEDEVQATRADLVHATRLATMGELTASIAHEIKQPLSAILTNADTAELLLESENPSLEEVQQILAEIRRDDFRACEVISRLRDLLGKHEMRRLPIDLNDTIAEALQILAPEARRRGVAVTASRVPVPPVSADRVHIQQVVVNLVLNALDAVTSANGSERRVIVRVGRASDGAEVSVEDNGPGIDPSIKTRLFESFATTKSTGMGLGLSIARSIVEAHGGRIWAENTGGGAIFRFVLPVAAGDVKREGAGAAAAFEGSA